MQEIFGSVLLTSTPGLGFFVMAARGLKLWRRLGSTDKFGTPVLSSGLGDFRTLRGHLRSVCTRAVSWSSSEFSGRDGISGIRDPHKPGATRRDSSTNEMTGAGKENVANYRPKRSFGADEMSRSRGKFTGDHTDWSSSRLERAAGSSRKVEKPRVSVTSDFADYRGMQLVFLGTSSSIPTLKRSTSCIALRLVAWTRNPKPITAAVFWGQPDKVLSVDALVKSFLAETWKVRTDVLCEGSIFLFDCGEGAIRQMLKTPMKHYDVGNIFVTHMHGDHIYGLPGLLCRLGLKEFQNKEPIQLYGPQGLRQWIRATLKASHARVHPKYVVHELHLKRRSTNVAHSWNYVDENHEDELPGRDIQRSEDGLWQVLKDDKYTVRAGFLRHSIPCWGYVVEEHTRRGRFDVERARQAGVKPGKLFRMLEAGDSVMLADGKIVYPSDVLGSPRRGRKVVILGDTCDSKSLLAIAQEADVVVHEATVLNQDASEVLQRGHSTAQMAGEFARNIKADTLVLTHFSRKLDGALYVDEKSTVRETMGDLVSSAQEAFEKDNVIAAEDMMAITIQLEDKPPLKQHRIGASEQIELTQKKEFRHATSSEFDEKLPLKHVGSGQSLSSRIEDQKSLNKDTRSRRLSPSQLKDKTVFKNLQKRRSTRPRRPASLSE